MQRLSKKEVRRHLNKWLDVYAFSKDWKIEIEIVSAAILTEIFEGVYVNGAAGVFDILNKQGQLFLTRQCTKQQLNKAIGHEFNHIIVKDWDMWCEKMVKKHKISKKDYNVFCDLLENVVDTYNKIILNFE